MKFCPELGQQVFVHFLESPLVPTTFAGWCVDRRFKGLHTSFTLTDGTARRQFILHSPEVLSVYILDERGEDESNLNNIFVFLRDLSESTSLFQYRTRLLEKRGYKK